MMRRCPHCWFTGIEETCRATDRGWFHCTGCGLRWSDADSGPGSARVIERAPRVHDDRLRPGGRILQPR